jgi:hypothetical protein
MSTDTDRPYNPADGYGPDTTREQLLEGARIVADPQALIDEGYTEEILKDGFPRIPKRALASIVEEAFPEKSRGLAYATELEDLGRWLAAIAAHEMAGEPHGWPTRLAAAGAAAARVGDGWEHMFTGPNRDLVRAISVFFLRRRSAVLVDALEWEEKEDT